MKNPLHRKRRPHPAAQARHAVGAGSVAAMVALVGSMTVTGLVTKATTSTSSASGTTATSEGEDDGASATTPATSSSATVATAPAQQVMTVTSGS
ncbi:MAG TPA: hypothetical protein VFR41_01150 [Acidimicrobiia bacterium]|nr:hypothetical protein [Acidimicrobiia bacterium]